MSIAARFACAADKAGEITAEEAERRLATFECGPCPGYQAAAETESLHGERHPDATRESTSENRARCARDVRGNMLDVICIAATVIFFLVALAYVEGCEKL